MKKEIPIVDLYGKYDKGWKGILTPKAFEHPAKVAFKLAEAIYDYAFAQGWVKVGDRVLDPFGGIAGFAFHAMQKGLHWIGVELEEKFVTLGNANITSWNERFGYFNPKWGSAVLVQGDSRKLIQVLQAQGLINLAAGSPPYADQPINPGNVGNRVVKERWGKGIGLVAHANGYSAAPENLGNLPEGNVDVAISSAPFTSHTASDNGFLPPHARSESGRYEQSPSAIQMAERDGYGISKGQLGREQGETFWSAAKLIVEQTYLLLREDGHAFWVCKDFVRDRQIVPFCDQWQRLCESIGFETVCILRAWQTTHHGVQLATTHGTPKRMEKQKKSFFRRNGETNAQALKYWESVTERELWFTRAKAQTTAEWNKACRLAQRKKTDLPKPPTVQRLTQVARKLAYTEFLSNGNARTESGLEINYEQVIVMVKRGHA